MYIELKDYNFIKTFSLRKNSVYKDKLYVLFEKNPWYNWDKFLIYDAFSKKYDLVYNKKVFEILDLDEKCYDLCNEIEQKIIELQHISKYKIFDKFITYKEFIIYENIPKYISKKSFIDFSDKNYLSNAIIWSYYMLNIDNDKYNLAWHIDIMVDWINREFDKEYILPDDIVDFIIKYPKYTNSIKEFYNLTWLDFDNFKKFINLNKSYINIETDICVDKDLPF